MNTETSTPARLDEQAPSRQPLAGVRRDGAAYCVVAGLLARADVRLDGQRPWDLRLLGNGMPERVLAQGNLGLGEAYMDGQWDCERLDEFFDRVLRARLENAVRGRKLLWHHWRARLLNLQTEARAWQVGRAHYDLGNGFFAAMLDRRMTYTCAYWQSGARTLDEAQEAKLDMVCRKLQLQPGMRVLDIGCGWGSFMRFAAEHYGVHCVGATISTEQAALGREHCAGLPVEFRLSDYRGLDERFDRIVSLGMFEHVGRRNHDIYMRVAERCLKPDGLFLLHTIGRNQPRAGTDPWIDKYIFPNGEVPTVAQIGAACEGRFVVEDLHNFGADYDRTLMAWHANFESAWPRFQQLGERFRRLWRYYLLSCAGAFRSRDIQLWQWVLSSPGRGGVYRRISA
jgi:cyclopropane-fatty-acyl-phospholipid synthase